MSEKPESKTPSDAAVSLPPGSLFGIGDSVNQSLPRYVVDVDVSEQLERQRDAYAETLRIIAGSNDRSHHEAAFTALIRERHPELAP